MKTISGGLIALLAAGTVAASYFGCSSSENGSCGSDKGCKEKGDICVEHRCVPYISPAETPLQVFNLWAEAFSRNDLEGSLQYWNPGKSELCRNWLTNQEFLIKRGIIPPEGLPQSDVLPYIARQIQGATLVPTAVKGNYQEFKLEKACSSELDCPRHAPCIEQKCSGDQKIIFIPMWDDTNKKVVYKIEAF